MQQTMIIIIIIMIHIATTTNANDAMMLTLKTLKRDPSPFEYKVLEDCSHQANYTMFEKIYEDLSELCFCLREIMKKCVKDFCIKNDKNELLEICKLSEYYSDIQFICSSKGKAPWVDKLSADFCLHLPSSTGLPVWIKIIIVILCIVLLLGGASFIWHHYSTGGRSTIQRSKRRKSRRQSQRQEMSISASNSRAKSMRSKTISSSKKKMSGI